jgi:outer membrane protein, multidrug efflux system
VAQIKIASAQQQAAVASYGASVLHAYKEIEAAPMNEDLFRRWLNFLESALNDRNATARLAYDKYRDGNIDLESLLELQNKGLATNIEVIKARAAVLTNRIDLCLAIDGGL